MFDSDPTIETTTATITKNQKALSNSASVFYQEDPFAPNFASASDQEDPFAPIKDTLGFTASDQHTTQDQAFDSVSVFYQEDPFAPIKDTPGFTASDQDTTQDQAFDSASISDQKDPFAPYKPGFTPQRTKNHDNFYEMTLEEQMQQYDDE